MYFIVHIVVLFFMYNTCYGDDNTCCLPLVTGPCKAAFPRYGYVDGQGCTKFTYGGCQGNANNFETIEECEAACGSVCSLPLVTGPCYANFQRYGFVEGKGCTKFTYGGCQGNGNNFETLEACEDACGDICSLPLVTGPCRAAITRYGYVEGQGCTNFTYGGCQGNENNFETLDECEDTCGDVCSLPLVTGPCDAAFLRYGYVEGEGCTKFTYGGCGGNANNYETLSDCESACGCPP